MSVWYGFLGLVLVFFIFLCVNLSQYAVHVFFHVILLDGVGFQQEHIVGCFSSD